MRVHVGNVLWLQLATLKKTNQTYYSTRKIICSTFTTFNTKPQREHSTYTYREQDSSEKYFQQDIRFVYFKQQVSLKWE